jgi:predicted protein tyrosine phosphatase
MTLEDTGSIHVCPLRRVPEMVERTSARHLVSVLNADMMPVTPPTISPGRHLKLSMHDIIEAQTELTPPAVEHVTDLFEFVQSWNKREPILIHCYAGISRSTAAAFIALCALNPGTPERIIAMGLRRSSDTARPNRLLVTLADKALGREGRMIAAIDAMGQSRTAMEAVPFRVACTT